ncbi:Clan CD, family C13, asparaginyl endopeptidase-like cysteine peptidase [Trichomonas vaginalis G3]|uniref:Clan CD, family C13, asparaginyl endopeptidase-like cysteine peptidase n=1 Tax=Trichomonas vaginalis (strain ATCC PRA-98 / G3) TaxID=412133 RepID=A2D8J8_TRIV3|nr:cysteine-type peptidase protein [Trichomonas vaginalis G3]EAY23247.1 Clan CD, family C13, asparaginyl endopeptidase-like cysteine peptidase [Trichomonas vaginalis G3]KAI5534104.1 cysteine-type peptidase protein [Trichomonas vaginalis G3]|eukprot:XP_001584233.1 Clan CD, family C13, asparaginyl endopeptidase-like cysteine peptidase [Trichomonas vaginalis G3]
MFLFLSLGLSAKYAILFAGSNSYTNYRHQADVFYMYQLLKTHGFDDDHISLWAFNDIINNSLNPYPGKMFHTLNDKNIYPGDDKIDYKGYQVSSANLIKYLKHMNTTKDDDIFFYYNDHGAQNILACPDESFITTYELANTFNTMHKLGKYKRIFFMVEACYSGCLAESVNSPNVAVITAAQCNESSYAAIRSPWTYSLLSNEFSTHSMSEIEMNPQHTIRSLFQNVHDKMIRSTPTSFGDILDTPISEFIGVGPKSSIRRQAFDYDEEMFRHPELHASREALDEYKQYQKEQKSIAEKMERSIKTVVEKVAGKQAPLHMKRLVTGDFQKCYEPVLHSYFGKLGKFNQDYLYLISPLKSLCANYDSQVIIEAIESAFQ